MEEYTKMDPLSNTAEHVANAALAVFADTDFHRATIRQIAKRAGVAQATIYKHFRNKEDLLDSVAAETLREMTEGLKEHLQGVRGALSRLRKMTWFCLRFYELNPKFAWVLYAAMPAKGWIESKGMDTAREQTRILGSILKQGQESGEIRPDIDARLVITFYFGGLQRLTLHWLLVGRSYGLANYADEFADMFLAAISTKEAAAPFRCPFLEAGKDLAPPMEKEGQRDS